MTSLLVIRKINVSSAVREVPFDLNPMTLVSFYLLKRKKKFFYRVDMFECESSLLTAIYTPEFRAAMYDREGCVLHNSRELHRHRIQHGRRCMWNCAEQLAEQVAWIQTAL